MAPRSLGLHILGSSLGGGFTGLVLGLLGSLFRALVPLSSDFLVAAFLIVLSYGVVVDLGIPHVPRMDSGRQTTGNWLCSIGKKGALFGWGIDLGNSFTTRLPYHVVAALPAYCFLLAGPLSGAAVLGLYGLARSLIVTAAVLAAPAHHADTCRAIAGQHDVLRGLVAGAGLAAVILFLAR